MPQIFRMGEYWIYFWTNENKPIEPVHVKPSEYVSVMENHITNEQIYRTRPECSMV